MNLVNADRILEAKEDFDFALSHCKTCVDYHTTRPFLILSGVRQGPSRDRELFSRLLKRVFPVNGSLLIAGSADAGLLEFTVNEIGDLIGSIDIADQCPSPLHACQRWADKRNLKIDTYVRDLTNSEAFGRYDIIISHLIMPYLSVMGRVNYLKLMRSMLRPNGRLIIASSQRMHSNSPSIRLSQKVMDTLRRNYIPLPEDEKTFASRLDRLMEFKERSVDGQKSKSEHHDSEDASYLTDALYAEAGLKVEESHKIQNRDEGRSRIRTYDIVQAIESASSQ